MHPFDLKTVLLAKHAQHVVLIHFPIALLLAGVLFDFLGHWTRKRELTITAYYCLLTAALTSLPVLITGVLAWQFALEGQHLKGILLMHLVLGCISSLMMWIVWFIHWKARRTKEYALPGFRLPIEAITAVSVIVTGHLGGFLSGVNGPG